MNLLIVTPDSTFSFRVGIRHNRDHKFEYDNGLIIRKYINEKGGFTAIAVIDKEQNNKLPRCYVSKCSSLDVFNKRVGILYCVQDLIWELIGQFETIDRVEYNQNGNLMEVYTIRELDSPMLFRQNVRILSKHERKV